MRKFTFKTKLNILQLNWFVENQALVTVEDWYITNNRATIVTMDPVTIGDADAFAAEFQMAYC